MEGGRSSLLKEGGGLSMKRALVTCQSKEGSQNTVTMIYCLRYKVARNNFVFIFPPPYDSDTYVTVTSTLCWIILSHICWGTSGPPQTPLACLRPRPGSLEGWVGGWKRGSTTPPPPPPLPLCRARTTGRRAEIVYGGDIQSIVTEHPPPPLSTTVDGKPEDMRHALMECRFLPPAYHVAVQCMGPAVFQDTTETDPQVLLWDMPVLSLQSPLGLIMWTAIMASYGNQGEC